MGLYMLKICINLIIQDDFVCQWKKIDRCVCVLAGRTGMFNIIAHKKLTYLFGNGQKCSQNLILGSI